MTSLTIQMAEWQARGPEEESRLAQYSFGDDGAARGMADRLSREGRLRIRELRQGLSIQTTSYVGNIQLGSLQVVIRPKLDGLPLLNLLRYAYGLRDLTLYTQTVHALTQSSFQDLLIHQLLLEGQELIHRGLHREYEPVRTLLASPRGRVDFQRYVTQIGQAQAALPCTDHPRTLDSLLNQTLAAGLLLGARLTQDLELRVGLRRLALQMDGSVRPIRLDSPTLREAVRQLDRRTEVYRPALQILALLMQATGTDLAQPNSHPALPGFLFDMNRFFQALLSRFLHEHLTGYPIRDEFSLRGMMTYLPDHNPQHRQAPTPRPDYAIQQGGKVLALLDAKYRDLWAHTLPRDMLYQLALYALSQPPGMTAAILYPTLAAEATEARIQLSDPVGGGARGYVALRPVNLLALEQIIVTHDGAAGRGFAHYLAFGKEQTP